MLVMLAIRALEMLSGTSPCQVPQKRYLRSRPRPHDLLAFHSRCLSGEATQGNMLVVCSVLASSFISSSVVEKKCTYTDHGG